MAFPRDKATEPSEGINQLLIRCIDFRKKLASLNVDKLPQLEEKESFLKDEIIAKFRSLPPQNESNLISINLYIEETLNTSGPHKFVCDPKWTVRTAKCTIKKKFNLDCPEEVIFILHGDKISEDYATLWQCDIRESNNVLYVYVAHGPMKEESSSIESSAAQSLSFTDEITSTVQTVHLHETVEPANFNSDKKDNETIGLNEVEETLDVLNIGDAIDEGDASEFEQVIEEIQIEPVGWMCQKCTYVNKPTRPGCAMCAEPRPDDYQFPDDYVPSLPEQNRIREEEEADRLTNLAYEEKQKKKEMKRQLNYQSHMSAVDHDITISDETIECSICITDTVPGEAVMLAECLHTFCKECVVNYIMLNEEVLIGCPFVDDNYVCTSHLQEREIRSLLPPEKFEKYLSKSLAAAEKETNNSFHCRTADCHGWCEYDDGVNIFKCPVCNLSNCLTCKAIHENQNCKQYQEGLIRNSATNADAKKTRKMLENLVKQKLAIHCPRCNIIILKKDGCDWLRCTMCKLEICWVTKGPRWGPYGKGDTSGGCHCREGGKKCHQRCVNCH